MSTKKLIAERPISMNQKNIARRIRALLTIGFFASEDDLPVAFVAFISYRWYDTAVKQKKEQLRMDYFRIKLSQFKEIITTSTKTVGMLALFLYISELGNINNHLSAV